MKIILTVLIILISSCECFSQTGWIQQNSGTTLDLNSVKFLNLNTGWCVGDSGMIMYTTNSGINWNQQPIANSTNLNSIIFSSQHTGYIAGNAGLILKTTDAGKSWNVISFLTSNLSSLFFVNDSNGYVGGRQLSDIYKTSNGGSSWSSSFIGGKNVKCIYFVNESTGFISTSHFSGDAIYKTTDRGNNWDQVHFTARIDLIESIFFVDSLHGWAASPKTEFHIRTIFKTINGGENWTETSSSHLNLLTYSLYFTDLNNGWAAGEFGVIFKTSNGGTNWKSQTPNILGRTYRSIYFVDSYTGWCVGDSGKVLKTTTGGLTKINNPALETADDYFLSQNYPNPFNPKTSINYKLKNKSFVQLKVFNVLGNEVLTLVNEKKPSGNYEAEFDGSNLSSGIYIYSLTVNGNTIDTKRMVLLK